MFWYKKKIMCSAHEDFFREEGIIVDWICILLLNWKTLEQEVTLDLVFYKGRKMYSPNTFAFFKVQQFNLVCLDCLKKEYNNDC